MSGGRGDWASMLEAEESGPVIDYVELPFDCEVAVGMLNSGQGQ